ncbi:Golgi-associated plant pathogenesis-related protein 1-like [Bradysia coprophila]|uniref:Golgi-associated plant pathogenesis-related protein 1-like n=1 Tax=Bradysia coprophila TaxID=38358 RepID=UPI00187D8451|nr:Golgi-associated plant pathogenesis-related protein 1-like [Bradysia coprophila]
MAPTLQSNDVFTKTDTKANADGSILTITTTTNIKKYSDGSTVTKVKKQTETTPAGYSSNTGQRAIKGNPYEFGYNASQSMAAKVAITTSKEFKKHCLDEHNRLRAMHHAPPLKLSLELSKIAQGWANKLAKDEKIYYSTYEFGENIYSCTGDRPSASTDAVKAWYDEIKYWDWKKMSGNGKGETGHFTQLIWKRSKEIGVAAAYSKDGRLFVVVEYNPPGNFTGRYWENVLPK